MKTTFTKIGIACVVVFTHGLLESYPMLKIRATEYVCQPKFIEDIKFTLNDGSLKHFLSDSATNKELEQLQTSLCQ